MLKTFRSAIFRKVLLVMLAMALFPALLLGWMAVRSGLQAGETSTALSRTALDAKSQEALELRAVETAAAIAAFLKEREGDLHALALLPVDSEAYFAFYNAHEGELWGIVDGDEYRPHLPLYRELAYIDVDGQELVKVSLNGIAAEEELYNLNQSGSTLYPNEEYFSQALALDPGEIYIGRVAAYFVSKQDYEAGQRYQGIIRFAMPVYQGGELSGVAAVALDVRHLMEFTAHIVPTEERFAAVPDPASGSYAYLIDNHADTIAHPNQFYLKGLAPDGEELPYVLNVDQIGTNPIRLDLIGFLDQNLAGIHAVAMEGQAGSIQYVWSGKDKFVAYAPIPYFSEEYPAPGGFGWIGIASEVGAFHQAATVVGETIKDRVNALMVNIVLLVIIEAVVLVPIAWVLARGIVSPIRRVTQAAQRVEEEDSDLSVLDPLLERSSNDEMFTLASVFKRMALQVYRREATLKETISQLRIEINEARKQKEVSEVVESEYFKNLQEHARNLKNKKEDQEE